MTTPQVSRLKEALKIVSEIATTVIATALIGAFLWIRSIDRDMIIVKEKQENQLVTQGLVMGSITTMASSMGNLAERMARLEATVEAEHDNR